MEARAGPQRACGVKQFWKRTPSRAVGADGVGAALVEEEKDDVGGTLRGGLGEGRGAGQGGEEGAALHHKRSFSW
jgi:hypothetical protein